MTLPPPVPSLAEAAAQLEAGLSPVALMEAALARIAALEPRLHAFITLAAETALAAAREAERAIKAGRRQGPLHGIPYALKDIYDAADLPTTAHSRLLEHNIALRNSDAADRLEAAGMILLGKLSTHEFARGGPTDSLPWPNARNPWNLQRFAGGSSSGSGVAVASGMVGLAMGSDTGGSIRLPAAYCGVVGLKPTYGRLSRFGVVPLSFSMDHTGPLTRTVEDCALAMQVLAGHDPRDPASAPVPPGDYLSMLRSGVKGLRIGLARRFDEESLIDAVQAKAIGEAARLLADLGAEIVDIELPSRKLMDACLQVILLAEGFAIHREDLRARPEAYGRVTRERLMMGAFVTGSDYVQAQRWRRHLADEMQKLLMRHDAILCSGLTGEAPFVAEVDEGPFRKHHPITGPFNATGQPALAVPIGFGPQGMPLSMQLVGANFGEATLLRIAHAYEAAAGWISVRPSL